MYKIFLIENLKNIMIRVLRVRTGKKLDALERGAAMKVVVLIAQLSSESSTAE